MFDYLRRYLCAALPSIDDVIEVLVVGAAIAACSLLQLSVRRCVGCTYHLQISAIYRT